MYKQTLRKQTTIKANESIQGEPIEAKIRRIVNNKEPITDNAPIVYTERKDGVQPAYDIRTDRWEVALDAMDKVSKTHRAKREERHKAKDEKPADDMGKQAKDGMDKEMGNPEKN